MANLWTLIFDFTGPVAEIALIAVLFYRHRYSAFKAFAAFLLADVLIAVSLNAVYAAHAPAVYRDCYFAGDVVFFGLQICVIVELARSIIRPLGKWDPDATRYFLRYSVAGAILAIAATFLLAPDHVNGMELFLVRLEVVGDLLMTGFVLSMMLAASSLGLQWTNHVIAIGQGMMVLALSTVTVDSLSLYLPTSNPLYKSAYYIRSVLYLTTILYWCVALWRNEPVRKPVSPALRKYIVALHDQVQYDLGKVRH